jgi:subtilisin family serine protease
MQLVFTLFAVSAILGQIIPDRHIVKFHESRSISLEDSLNSVAETLSTGSRSDNKIVHQYSEIFPGASVFADSAAVDRLRLLPEVRSVEPVYHVYSNAAQRNATWGIARVSQREKLACSSYEYNYDENAGQGVNIYVVDTGVNINHVDFEGRASWGYTAIEGAVDEDGNGHGTHCAGIAASKTYGVAKKANIIAVKVLDDHQSGTTDDITAGLEWVIKHNSGYNKKVISMSIGSDAPGDWLNDEAESVYANGIIIVVSAGNKNDDACKYTPSGAPSAITVAASNIKDEKRDLSNYGKCVDVIAPGVDILSTYIGSNTATSLDSGTSMACPHVAGIAATFLSQGVDFKDIDSKIKSTATKGAITGFNQDTLNYLAFNNYKK